MSQSVVRALTQSRMGPSRTCSDAEPARGARRRDRPYRDPAWARLGIDWQAELEPDYETAKRMLGRALNPSLTEIIE